MSSPAGLASVAVVLSKRPWSGANAEEKPRGGMRPRTEGHGTCQHTVSRSVPVPGSHAPAWEPMFFSVPAPMGGRWSVQILRSHAERGNEQDEQDEEESAGMLAFSKSPSRCPGACPRMHRASFPHALYESPLGVRAEVSKPGGTRVRPSIPQGERIGGLS